MRLKVIRLAYFIAIVLIVLRLGYWQIVMSDDLVARAEGQRVLSREIPAPRGEILYADGSVLASTQPIYLLFVQPKVINEQMILKQSGRRVASDQEIEAAASIPAIIAYKQQFAKNVAQILWEEDEKYADSIKTEISTDSAKLEQEQKDKEARLKTLEDSIFQKLNKNLYWVSLNKKIDTDVKRRLDSLNLIGLGFDESNGRFYPEGSSSAHLLGFVSSNDYGDDTGYFGLEGYYNGELRGKNGTLRQERDALGLPILIGDFLSKDPKPGKTLTLTIDRTIQYMVEQKLQKGMQKYQAKGASAVVMDPMTGNILAMASIPSYDPTKPIYYPKESFRNPITADGYEPGSTFKVLVMAAGINEGVVKADTVCDNCSGPLNLAGFTIRTWNNKYQDRLTMTDAIIHSDNTGMVYVGNKMGIDKMYDYIKNFGFGDVTGVDLQDEHSPDLRPKKDWKEIDLATSSFGQGISVTPLQIVRAVSAIANGGKLMEPHIVSTITDGKDVFTVKPRVVKEPIKAESAKVVTQMMVQAVEEGEAKFAKPKGYVIAGKTGTAQIAVAGHYDPTKTIASFVGFAPAENPKFVMLVRYVEPGTSIYGAETAAPTFFEISKELFLYYGIPPQE